MASQNTSCQAPNNSRNRLALSELVALALAVTFGTIIVEDLVRIVLRTSLTPYRWASLDPLAFIYHAVFWVTLAADGLTFILVTVLLVPIVFCMRRRRALFVVSFLLFLLAAHTCSWPLAKFLHSWATVALELGFAIAASRLMVRADPRSLSFARWTILPLGIGSLVLAVTVPLWRDWQERRAVAALPSAAPGTPNVLLITLDTVRAENLELYGYLRQTMPHLTKLAGEGAMFARAMAPCCWTLPTHASLFTGTLPHENQADCPLGFTVEMKTLADELRAAGVVPAGFYANVVNCGVHTGLGRGFIHYRDFEPDQEMILLASPLMRPRFPQLGKRKSAADVNAEFLGWLEHGQKRPFFAFLNYFDAHQPYETPDPQFDRFTSVPVEQRKEFRARLFATAERDLVRRPEMLQALVDAYDGAVAYMDQQLHELFAELDRRGILRDTLVIVTADHGEHFGEHAIVEHGKSMYRQEIDVPLVIWKPGLVPTAGRIESPVSLVDIPQTILELVGVTGRISFPGKSLAHHWRAGEGHLANSDVVAGEVLPTKFSSPRLWHTGAIRSIFADGFHYLRNERLGTEELYDMLNDPREATDLISLGVPGPTLDRIRSLADEVFGHAPPNVDRSLGATVTLEH